MRSVDETQHHAIGSAQPPGALDDGPEHHVEVGGGPPHRGQHRVGGRDLFPSIVEIPPKMFDRRDVDQLGPGTVCHSLPPVTGGSR